MQGEPRGPGPPAADISGGDSHAFDWRSASSQTVSDARTAAREQKTMCEWSTASAVRQECPDSVWIMLSDSGLGVQQGCPLAPVQLLDISAQKGSDISWTATGHRIHSASISSNARTSRKGHATHHGRFRESRVGGVSVANGNASSRACDGVDGSWTGGETGSDRPVSRGGQWKGPPGTENYAGM